MKQKSTFNSLSCSIFHYPKRNWLSWTYRTLQWNLSIRCKAYCLWRQARSSSHWLTPVDSWYEGHECHDINVHARKYTLHAFAWLLYMLRICVLARACTLNAFGSFSLSSHIYEDKERLFQRRRSFSFKNTDHDVILSQGRYYLWFQGYFPSFLKRNEICISLI